jgi:hypothetical protein
MAEHIWSLAGNTRLMLDPPALYPADLELKMGVSVVCLAGGASKRYNHGIPVLMLTMEWTKERPMSIKTFMGGYDFSANTQTVDTQSFVNWIKNVAIGPLNPFTDTDPSGVARTVFLKTDLFQFKHIHGSGYIGAVSLVFEG